jgi:hypothetical protein
LTLNRLFINFAGKNAPQPDADPAFDATTDRTAQRWVETQLATGRIHSAGGPESIQEFHNRGSYYTFLTPQDAGSRATRVIVHQGFDGSAGMANTRVLLFSHHTSVVQVNMQDGMVTNVQVTEK